MAICILWVFIAISNWYIIYLTGKLTKAQIKQGYSALKEIEGLIEAGDRSFKLTQACNDFYTRIPHDFG